MFAVKRTLVVGGMVAAAAFAGVAGSAGVAGADTPVSPQGITFVTHQGCIDGGGTPVYPPNTYGFCKGGAFNGYPIPRM